MRVEPPCPESNALEETPESAIAPLLRGGHPEKMAVQEAGPHQAPLPVPWSLASQSPGPGDIDVSSL